MALFLARAGLRMEACCTRAAGLRWWTCSPGRCRSTSATSNELIPHLASRRIRVLAVSGDKRASQLPDVRRSPKQGYPGFRTETWNGRGGARRHSAGDRRALAREIALGCKDAGFVGRLDRIGVDAVCSTPAEFAGAIRQDLELWKEAVRAAGIQ